MRVVSNTAVSLDGKIATYDNGHVEIASRVDRMRMHGHRAAADAVFVGGATFRAWPLPLVEDPTEASPQRPRPILNAVLTRGGIAQALRRKSDRWPDPRVRLVVFGPPTLRDEALPDWVEVRTHETPGPAWVLAELHALGVQTVLVEGGGDLVFQLLDQGLLDEMYVTLAHRIVGGATSKTLADGRGFTPDRICELELMSVQRAQRELYLHYAVRAPAPR